MDRSFPAPDSYGIGPIVWGKRERRGTHIGILTGEFGDTNVTAIQLPATSGTGTPAITDWVTCGIGSSTPGGPPFADGADPHTVTAYQSPNSGDAIALPEKDDLTPPKTNSALCASSTPVFAATRIN